MSEPLRHQRLTGLICLALGLITLGLYLPALRHDFLDYDDQQYVTENPHVRAGLTTQGFVWAFGRHASNWHPLTWFSHMLDCNFYGLKPAGHHLTSILLHVATTMLLFLVFQRMTGAVWRSAGVAALFGWHPLHVESVAWVAERKDVLSAFFWMATLAVYARYARHAEGRAEVKNSKFEIRNSKSEREREAQGMAWHPLFYYGLALALFALGLMAKPMVVTLPFVLLLLDYWPLGRTGTRGRMPREPSGGKPDPHYGVLCSDIRGLLLEKVPFFVLSAAACVLTVSAQRQSFSVVSTAGLPVAQRVGHALLAYGHYLGATFMPLNLAVYYPYERALPAVRLVLAGLVLAGITLFAGFWAKRRPYLIVGWLWFLGTLVPVIGLVQVGDQAWADRYTYLPLIGVFVMVVWGVVEVGEKLQGPSSKLQGNTKDQAPSGATNWPKERLLVAGLALVACALLVLSSRQLSYWRDTRTLFEHAERVTPRNHMAITLLGSLLAREGKLDEAIARYRTALGYQPGYAEAHFFLGNAFDQQGKLAEAIAEYQQAVGFKPMQEQTHIFLGVALAKQKQYDAAAVQYRAALKINPESVVAHNNLARVLQTQDRLDEAIEHYFAALKLAPGLAQAHNNLGVLLLQKGRVAEGAAQLREAMRLSPGNAETQYNLGLALNQQEQWSEAAGLFARTVDAASTDPNAHYQFAVALAWQQKTREAMRQFASALLLKQDFPDALDGLAWILATASAPEFRNGTEAVRMAERACELTGRKEAEKLKTLAAAYAEVGRFPDAAATVQSARELAMKAGRQRLVAQCDLMSGNFASAKPWRELPAGP